MLQTRHLHSRTNIPTSIIVFSEDKHIYLGDMSYSVFYRVVYKLNGFTAARMANSVFRPLHVLCKNYFPVFNEGAIIHLFALQDDVKSQLLLLLQLLLLPLLQIATYNNDLLKTATTMCIV